MSQKLSKELKVPFTVDLISDLNLETLDGFNWEDKATSLFLVIAGNLSDDLDIIDGALRMLSSYYRGIIYIDGNTEHPTLSEYEPRCLAIKKICKNNVGVVYLHNHVVILNGVAFVGINGWNANRSKFQSIEDLSYIEAYKEHDIAYLVSTIKAMQDHPEAKQIVIVSNSLPSKELTLGDTTLPTTIVDTVEPILTLYGDTQKKIGLWLFGSYQNTVDTTVQDRRFVNNPHIITGVYLPKRITI